jgi:uncharacterized protein Veg
MPISVSSAHLSEGDQTEMTNRRMLLTLAIGSLISGNAVAQNSSLPIRLRGKIDTVFGDTVQLTLRNGVKASVELPPNLRVVWLTEARPDEVKQGSYVGTVAVPQADGLLKALEVQVFPPSMRGSSMTNGTVGNLVASNGRTITITYKGGEKRVVVPDDVPIVTYEPGDRAALTAGGTS